MADGFSARSGLPDVRYGTVVGRDFMVLRLLRRGSTSAVYIAEQLSTSGQRALKILRREYVADDTLFKRFEREAQMAARIPSEHVTQIIASGVDEKLKAPWIAMELLEGQHLGDHVAERGPLPPDQVCAIFEQICHALAAAHKIGVVHRDLKPANIFLGESTRGEAATAQTDVWALGLLAFYMLTGKYFWRACSRPDYEAHVMREIRDDAVPIASMRALELGVSDLVPKGFDPWFAQCVARTPGDRFFTASATCAALLRTLG